MAVAGVACVVAVIDSEGAFTEDRESQEAGRGGKERSLTKQIGIVAVSPEGAALCHRQIFRHASALLDPHDHPIVSMHNLPLAQYVDAVRSGDWRAVGALLRLSADVLASCGAELCFTPDNAVQHGVHLAQAGSPIPWLNMTDIVAGAVEDDGRQMVGILGTSVVTRGSAYQTHLGLRGVKAVAPSDEDIDALDTAIYGDLAYGRITDAARDIMTGVVDRFHGRGCDAVILGCSEAPLVVGAPTAPIAVYDAGDILAERAVREAMKD